MRVFVEVTEETDEPDENGNPIIKKHEAWLLHWGLKSDLIEIGDGRVAPMMHTIAVCQDYETGDIRCFDPEQIKILGIEKKL